MTVGRGAGGQDGPLTIGLTLQTVAFGLCSRRSREKTKRKRSFLTLTSRGASWRAGTLRWVSPPGASWTDLQARGSPVHPQPLQDLALTSSGPTDDISTFY